MSYIFRSASRLRLFSSRSLQTSSKPQTVCSFYECLTPNEGAWRPTDVVVSRGYVLPEAGKAALVDSVVPPLQVQGFLSQFNLTRHDVQYVIVTGSDLFEDASEMITQFPNAVILAPVSANVDSETSTQQQQQHKVNFIKEGDSVTVGTSRRLSFYALSSHIAVYDHLHANVFAGTSFAISLSSTFTPSNALLLPPCVATENDHGWPQNYLEYIEKIAATGCKRVYIYGGGPIELTKEATECLHQGVRFLVEVLQTATWRARDGKSSNDLKKWVEKELTEYFVQRGRDGLLSNEQMTKAGTLSEWLAHVPVLVAKSQRLAASARPVSPPPSRVASAPKFRSSPHSERTNSPNKLWLGWMLLGRRYGLPPLLIDNIPPLLIGVTIAAIIFTGAELFRASGSEQRETR